VTFFWLCTILAWVYNVPVKLGLEVSQYLLVFTVGFWLNKLRMYDRLLSFKTAYVAAPLAALFSIDFSSLFNTINASQTFLSLLYFTGRSVILSICVIVLVLTFLRKLSFPYLQYIELIAKVSIFIYLTEPIVSYAIRLSVFGQTTIYFASGADFYIYIAIRIAVLFIALPLVLKVIKNYKVSRRSIVSFEP
jgi:hypothetical protein